MPRIANKQRDEKVVRLIEQGKATFREAAKALNFRSVSSVHDAYKRGKKASQGNEKLSTK